MIHEDGWLSSSEVAALFGVSSRQVTAWARAGDIPAERVGERAWRFPAVDIADIVGLGIRSARAMSAAEVAKLFKVRRETVARWVREGRLPVHQTPRGHARFDLEELRELRDLLLADGGMTEADTSPLLRASPAARQLGTTRKALAKAADAGRLAADKTLGGQRRYPESQIDRRSGHHGVQPQRHPS